MKATKLVQIPLVVFCTFLTAVSLNAAGLIHQWSAEGNANDSVGAANGTITNLDGSPNIDVTYVTGPSNQAFAFDGNGYIDFGTNVAAFGTSDFTISFWIQSTETSEQCLLNKMDGYYLGRGFAISMTNGFIRCVLRSASGEAAGVSNAVDVTSLSPVNDGAFHHVALERSETNLYVFVDGVISGRTYSTSVLNLSEAPYVVTNQIPVTNEFGMQLLWDDGTFVYADEVDEISQPVPCLGGAGQIAQLSFTETFDGINFGFDSSTVVTVGKPFVGALDEIQIYSRALTAYEIYSVTHPGVGLAIIDQPLNQHALAGRPVILHLLAVGVDPITYQWRLNGYDIPGAISNNLVLDAPQTFDSGTYSVLVSNPTGDLTSRDATLVVTNLTTPGYGLIARWSAEGTASDAIGGHDGITRNIKYVSGVLGTAFQFNGNSFISCGNIFGTMGTNDFTLDFWMRTTSKARSEAVVGQRPYCSWTDCWDIRFNNYSDGLSALQTELGDHYDVLNPEFNAEQPTTAPAALHLNDGVFHHVCTVHRANTLTLFVDGKYIDVGVSETVPTLQNDGSFDMGINVCDEDDGTVPFTGALDEIEIYNRALSDEEVYNTYSPNPALTLIRQPATTAVIEGQSATLFVSAAGQQPITYQWMLNGAPIAGATDATYALTSAQLTDAGIYSVAVSNTISSVTSLSGVLTVIPANTILPGLVNYWPAEGTGQDIVGHVSMQGGGNVGYAAGVSGQAFTYNGDNQSNGANSEAGDFGTNDFTIHYWINNQNDGVVMSKLGAFDMFCWGGNISMNLNDDTGHGGSINSGGASVGYNAFHQVDVVRQSMSNLLMYIDGALVSRNTCAISNLHTIWGLGICDEYGRTKRFGGLLDEIQFYYRALTPAEISWLYNRYASGPRAPMTSVAEMTQLAGSSFTLTAPPVMSSSPGTITYQWMVNGVPIPGATGSSLTVNNFDPSGAGNYVVTVTDANGSVATLVARVSAQLAAGSYNGLFYYDGDVNDDTSGFITLTLTSKQSYTAAIKQQGHSYGFTGKFSANSSTVQVKRTAAGKSPLTVTISAAAGGDGRLTGVVRDTTRNIPLVMQRAVYSAAQPTPQAGAYTLSLFGLSSPAAPNGHGYGNVTITPSGAVKFSAYLADDSSVSQNVGVARSGVWPLYAPAYKGKGSVLGWLSFNKTNANACSGTLRWVKSRLAGGSTYTSGFATKIPVVGSTFIRPRSGLGIHLDNSSVVVDGAKIYSALSDPIVATNSTSIVFSQSGASNGKLTVYSSTGQFKGLMFNPVTHANTTVKGVVLQNQGYAAGYFLSSGLSGRVVLQHN